MFAQLFDFKILENGQLRIAVRSNERRVDEYIFNKSDIEPALDDDPHDDLWSGSAFFKLKRTRSNGFIKIALNSHSIVYKVSRQDIEILNAQLKSILEDLKDVERSTIEIVQENKITVSETPDFDELLSRFRDIIREELKGVKATSVGEVAPEISIPKVTFIPSGIGANVEGEIKTQGQESDAFSAIQAAKKLKEMKK